MRISERNADGFIINGSNFGGGKTVRVRVSTGLKPNHYLRTITGDDGSFSLRIADVCIDRRHVRVSAARDTNRTSATQ